EYLLATADSVAARRILCVLTHRPGYTRPFGERTYHTRVALTALAAQDTLAILADADLPEAVKALVARKAEGNPFFVEEIVKSLREAGAIRPARERPAPPAPTPGPLPPPPLPHP